VAGFALAHERYGSATPWADLVEPAVGLAGDGFTLSPALARSLANVLPRMEPYPASVAQFSKNGVPYEEGELFRQPDLARTLARIRDQGHDGFYSGETARLLAEEMVRGGGMITEEDLARYQAHERTPIHGTYRGYDLVSMPPPSSGGTAIVQMLNILEGFDLAALGHNSAAYVHHLTEAMRLAYRDRAQHLADTDFVDVPLERLTSKDYADELRGGIHADQAGHSEPSQLVMAEESTETTHYSVVDRDGMAVSVTYTLEQGYGSKITVPGAGFLLNNEMGDFNGKPGLTNERGLIGTEANLARPEQRMLSSMSPSVLSRDGELVAVIGTPGGRTIINTVMQLVLNIVDHGMTIEEAVAAPRIHHQWLPNNVRIEEGGVSDGDVAALQAQPPILLLILLLQGGQCFGYLHFRATCRLGKLRRRNRVPRHEQQALQNGAQLHASHSSSKGRWRIRTSNLPSRKPISSSTITRVDSTTSSVFIGTSILGAVSTSN